MRDPVQPYEWSDRRVHAEVCAAQSYLMQRGDAPDPGVFSPYRGSTSTAHMPMTPRLSWSYPVGAAGAEEPPSTAEPASNSAVPRQCPHAGNEACSACRRWPHCTAGPGADSLLLTEPVLNDAAPHVGVAITEQHSYQPSYHDMLGGPAAPPWIPELDMALARAGYGQGPDGSLFRIDDNHCSPTPPPTPHSTSLHADTFPPSFFANPTSSVSSSVDQIAPQFAPPVPLTRAVQRYQARIVRPLDAAGADYEEDFLDDDDDDDDYGSSNNDESHAKSNGSATDGIPADHHAACVAVTSSTPTTATPSSTAVRALPAHLEASWDEFVRVDGRGPRTHAVVPPPAVLEARETWLAWLWAERMRPAAPRCGPAVSCAQCNGTPPPVVPPSSVAAAITMYTEWVRCLREWVRTCCTSNRFDPAWRAPQAHGPRL